MLPCHTVKKCDLPTLLKHLANFKSLKRAFQRQGPTHWETHKENGKVKKKRNHFGNLEQSRLQEMLKYLTKSTSNDNNKK